MTDKRKIKLYEALLDHLVYAVSGVDLYLCMKNIGFTDREIYEITEGDAPIPNVVTRFYDEKISERPLAKTETPFGTIYIEVQAAEDEKLRIYDSLGRYMGYYEEETFIAEAEKKQISFEDAIFDFCYELAENKHLGNLLAWLGDDGFASSSKSEIAEKLGLPVDCTEEELLENEFVNKIGETYVAIDD